MSSDRWKILLVEDDEDDYILTRALLNDMQGADHQLDWAQSFTEGLERACPDDEEESYYDVVLVDYHLRTGSGIDLIETATQNGCHAAFILLTGQGNYQVDLRAMQAGATDYLSKNEITPTLLERSLRYAVSNKRSAIQVAEANRALAVANQRYSEANRALAQAYVRLREREEALRVSEERFRLASAAVVGIIYDWDLKTGQIYRSEGLYEMIGYSPGEIDDSTTWNELIHPEDRERVTSAISKYINDGLLKYALEYRLRHKDGRWVHVSDQGRIVCNQSGEPVRVVGTSADISRQKELEAELRYSEERFRVALSNAPVMVATIDCDLKYTWLHNPRNSISSEEMVGKTDEALMPAEEAQRLMAIKRRVLETGKGFQEEIRLKTLAGDRVYILVLEPLRDARGEISGLTSAALDITAQREMERERIRYSGQMEAQRRLLDQREMERQQIARDLHDGPIQEVVGLMFALQMARNAPDDKPETKALIEQVYEGLSKLTQSLRSVTNELRPPLLVRFGLGRAIQAHAEEFAARNQEMKFDLALTKDLPSLADSTRLALFRIYQECLNNISRHAQATRVKVSLKGTKGQVQMDIEDNGRGFQAPSDWVDLAREGHLGLVGMRERAEAVGGRLEVTSRKGRGTRIRVLAPVPGPAPIPHPPVETLNDPAED